MQLDFHIEITEDIVTVRIPQRDYVHEFAPLVIWQWEGKDHEGKPAKTAVGVGVQKEEFINEVRNHFKSLNISSPDALHCTNPFLTAEFESDLATMFLNEICIKSVGEFGISILKSHAVQRQWSIQFAGYNKLNDQVREEFQWMLFYANSKREAVINDNPPRWKRWEVQLLDFLLLGSVPALFAYYFILFKYFPIQNSTILLKIINSNILLAPVVLFAYYFSGVLLARLIPLATARFFVNYDLGRLWMKYNHFRWHKILYRSDE